MKKFLLSPLALLISATSFAQVSIQTGTTITQNFNTIGNSATATLPAGWKVDKQAVERTIGTYAAAGTTTERAGGAGISNNQGIINLESATDVNDRAIGFLPVNTGTKTGNVYVSLQNSGATDIKSLSVSFDVEKYRNGSNPANFYFELYYSTDGVNWTSAGSASKKSYPSDGNIDGSASVQDQSTRNITGNLGSINIPQNSNYYLAWSFSVETGSSPGQGQILGVDNISITASATTLPVSLISQTAKADENQINLAWKTASELNNARFDILRANHTKSFIKIGEVKGAGTTQELKNYTFVDKQPLPGVNYYRLAQVDLDGKTTLSAIFSAKSNVAGTAFKIINKTDGNLEISLSTSADGQAKLVIFDINGRKITDHNFSAIKGYNTFLLPINASKGLYVANLLINGEKHAVKFIN